MLYACQYLKKRGFDVTYLPVLPDRSVGAGLVGLNEMKADTILVAVMWLNNETDVIQPIEEIAQLTYEASALFMTDATQAVGKLPIR